MHVEVMRRVDADPSTPLTFPPAKGDVLPRRTLAELGLAPGGGELRVMSPEREDKAPIGITGRVFRFDFDDPIDTATPAEKVISFSPPLAGKARWLEPATLEFTADAPLPIGTEYQVTLTEVTSVVGTTLQSPWKAAFLVKPNATVAGKELGYVPVVGKARPIVIHPSSERDVGPNGTMSVLFDQPIDLGLARNLVSLTDSSGRAISAILDHPKGSVFEGIKVDPRYVVLVRPASALRAAADVKLAARAQVREDAEHDKDASYRVAGPLVVEGVGCGYGSWDRDECVEVGGRLVLGGRAFHVRIANSLGMTSDALKRAVSVSPPVKGLSIYEEGWDQPQIVVSGDFAPSTTYNVTVAGLVDSLGQRLRSPYLFTVATRPMDASLSAPEGLVTLDAASAKTLPLTTRNVTSAELLLWPVADGPNDMRAALERTRARDLPAEPAPIVLPVAVDAKRDAMVRTDVDLSKVLDAGKSYIATARPKTLTMGAQPFEHARGSEAERPPVALLHVGTKDALAVHAHLLGDGTLVRVSRLATGEPVGSAALRIGTEEGVQPVMTDASGLAWVAGAAERLWVTAGTEKLFLDLGQGGLRASETFPDLAKGDASGLPSLRALVLTDRGIYRPGSKIFVKASVRRVEGDKLVALAGQEVHVALVGPTGDRLDTKTATISDVGSVDTAFDVAEGAGLGMHEVRVEELTREDVPIATTSVRVAEFEAPRFTVDVTAKAGAKGEIEADVMGRYLYGAPMQGAGVSWTITRRQGEVPEGALAAKGLRFTRERSWYDDDQVDQLTKTGGGVLSAEGAFHITQVLPPSKTSAPERISVEADVTDASYRHIAGRTLITRHTVSRYAGLATKSQWLDVGEDLAVSLGVVDTEGKTVAGATISAVLTERSWRYAKRRGPSGAATWDWIEVKKPAGRCTTKSAEEPVICKIRIPAQGSFELQAETGGHVGGSTNVWAWGGEDSDESSPFPARGRTVPVSADRARYKPGDVAKVFAPSPFADATAILTVEQGGLISRETKRVRGGAAVFDVPITAASAPWIHAAVTLLPMGAKGDALGDSRVGVVRLPVSLDGARLDVAASTDRATYGPGEEVEATVDVLHAGSPVAHADVALYAVDEGILRLTGHQAPEPNALLHPGRALDFRSVDSRDGLAELLASRHVAGDGGGPDMSSVSQARKRFVETAAWYPSLRTDDKGRARVRFKLPDNLTTFRVMAVALDADGRGGSVQTQLTVSKPLLLSPIVPRFALRGDRLEIGAQVASAADVPVNVTVRLGDQTRPLRVPAKGQSKVTFPFFAGTTGVVPLQFSVLDEGGVVRDAVDLSLHVDEPGIDERPRLAGAFLEKRVIGLKIPAFAMIGKGDELAVQVGEHLWPELGERLQYLLGYPHGCVEQTTSSTLPLIAARDILPRIGVQSLSQAELNKRIRAGLDRLATMRTSSGGLAYWPGGHEPNVFGTAYAARAFVLAKQLGIEGPSGVLDGMTAYLKGAMLASDLPPEVQAAIAQTLAELGKLEVGTADALFERAGQQTVFGSASLAVAFSSLKGQEDRVEKMLDFVEGAFDQRGQLTASVGHNDFYYYGSATRTRSAAAIALARLRPESRILPMILADLASGLDDYTTQAASYSLLALAEHLRGEDDDASVIRAYLDGKELVAKKDLGSGSRAFAVPLHDLRGKDAELTLVSEGKRAVSYQLAASWRRPLFEGPVPAASRMTTGPDVHRVITDPLGKTLDPSHIKAGDTVRVALLVRMPEGLQRDRYGYLAVTDRLPAGFEPVDPDLATVASAPDIGPRHPFADLLRWGGGGEPSHVELRDDRVQIYFDQLNDDTVVATYLARAVTPGDFVLPPAMAELMYEPSSVGWSDAGKVSVQ